MEDAASSKVPERKEKNRSIDFSYSKIILSFFLLVLGFGAISVGNFLQNVGPHFLGLNYTIFFTVETAMPPIGYLLIGVALFLFISLLFKNLTSLRIGPISTDLQQEDIKALRDKADKNPDKIEPIWDLGRANLQEYFNRNLGQISNIYRVSVIVMSIGFLLIIIGIFAGFVGKENSAFTPALIGVIAGIITEFIGATFLYMYRATVQQASEYMKTLERINRVGMATKILDTMSDDSKDLRDETKAALVKLLFSQDIDQNEEIKTDLSKSGRKTSKTRTQTKPVDQ